MNRHHSCRLFILFVMVWACLGPLRSGVVFAAVQAAQAAPTAPEAVTLYPDRALMECKETLTQILLPDGQRGILITLPSLADPSSLRISVAGGTLADVRWERVAFVDQGAVAAMRAELNRLYHERAAVTGELQATDARIAMWTETTIDTVTAAEMERIDAAMAKHLSALHNGRFGIALRHKALDESIRVLEDQLGRTVGGEKQVWQVQAALADAPATVTVRYRYMLGACGWTPSYRFEAFPGMKKVAFAFDAVIEQSSGMEWTNAKLALATVERAISLDPPQLPEWLVEERQIVANDGAAEMAAAPMRAAPMLKSAMMAPREIERGTYAVWDLGARTIPAGKQISLPVVAEEWGTAFLYTVRPDRDEKAYLTANVALPEPRELPQGEALFLVDGALIGKRDFRLSGSEADLFFGSDPLVTATQRLLDKQSGNKGVIGRKQTMVWAWDITLKNDRNHPVALLVEEPAPQPSHEDIRVETVSKPASRVTDDHIYVWEMQLSSRSSEVISHAVTVTAPKDMVIDFGRGR